MAKDVGRGKATCAHCKKEPVPLVLPGVDGRWRQHEIDRCIAPIVQALRAAEIKMTASCCGHGERPGYIDLADGRRLWLVQGAARP